MLPKCHVPQRHGHNPLPIKQQVGCSCAVQGKTRPFGTSNLPASLKWCLWAAPGLSSLVPPIQSNPTAAGCPRRAPGGRGWHRSTPIAALPWQRAEGSAGSCPVPVHHPHSAISREVSVSGDAQERLVLPHRYLPAVTLMEMSPDSLARCQESGTGLTGASGTSPRRCAHCRPATG